ncbi:MAG: type II secretion system protein [Oscillospiraceae bacterium]|nr:type II secretion system protein [Oscillospiraceae bacterium]
MGDRTKKEETRRRRKGSGGFTLVEVIVTLVVLAILAGIFIPSMTGYIDRAKQKTIIVGCRTCVSAAQTLAAEAYADGADDCTPAPADVLALAGVDGGVSGIGVDAVSAQVLHLTYEKDGLRVTYCADPDSCALHEQVYNFTDAADGGSAAGVTVTDSAGTAYTLLPTGDWTDVKQQILTGGWNIASGSILSDDTGTYLCCNWSHWVGRQGDDSLTLAALAAKYPSDFERLSSGTKIWSAADIAGGAWKSAPAAGDLCSYGGKYYVAPNAIGRWTLPPGGWVEVSQ